VPRSARLKVVGVEPKGRKCSLENLECKTAKVQDAIWLKFRRKRIPATKESCFLCVPTCHISRLPPWQPSATNPSIKPEARSTLLRVTQDPQETKECKVLKSSPFKDYPHGKVSQSEGTRSSALPTVYITTMAAYHISIRHLRSSCHLGKLNLLSLSWKDSCGGGGPHKLGDANLCDKKQNT